MECVFKLQPAQQVGSLEALASGGQLHASSL